MTTKTFHWLVPANAGTHPPQIRKVMSLATRLAYLPVAVIGLGPLLPVITLMCFVKWIDRKSETRSGTCDECPGPWGCPHFRCCREPEDRLAQ